MPSLELVGRRRRLTPRIFSLSPEVLGNGAIEADVNLLSGVAWKELWLAIDESAARRRHEQAASSPAMLD